MNRSHLKETTHAILCEYLKSKGNKLSDQHRDALGALSDVMTSYAAGELSGRIAFPMATGLGKTSGILAFCKAIHKLGLDETAVSVSAAKVEALCELKRDMMEMGIPESSIGLLHSYKHDPSVEKLRDGYASLPSDPDGISRQFMLVTHQRIKSSTSDTATFNTYKGKPRALMLWDESLVASDPVCVPIEELKFAIRGCSAYIDGSHTQAESDTYCYLNECIKLVLQELERQQGCLDDRAIVIPTKTESELLKYRSVVQRWINTNRAFNGTSVLTLLELSGEIVRIVPQNAGGVITYRVSVPSQLKNILILDASYPIRELMKADASIRDARRLHLKVDLSSVKRFDNVQGYWMKAPAGRNSATKKENISSITRDISKVIRENIPEDEKVLIFCFKRRNKIEPDAIGKIEEGLRVDGVDMSRISITTWGNETSSNQWANHKHVILAGILHIPENALTATYLGQRGSIHEPVVYEKDIRPLVLSECAHSTYQALSRGSCRVVNNGQAGEMTAWLIFKDKSLIEALKEVMPGCTWSAWRGTYSKTKETRIEKLAGNIRAYLEGLSEDVGKLSTSRLKRDMELQDIPRQTWTSALREALLNSSWMLDSRSVVRGSIIFTSAL